MYTRSVCPKVTKFSLKKKAAKTQRNVGTYQVFGL